MAVRDKILSILRLTRAHTVPLEAVPGFIGGLFGSGGSLLAGVFGGLFGALYHLAGYGHNSIRDYVQGYDKDDEYKQHHPLVTGELSTWEANKFVSPLIVLTLLIAAYYTFKEPLLTWYAVLAIAGGFAYNFVGKETMLKPIPITLSHSSVFILPYFAEGGKLLPGLIFSLFMFTWVFFQIGFSGEIAGITQFDEENFMRYLGTEVDERNFFHGRGLHEKGHTNWIDTPSEVAVLGTGIQVINGMCLISLYFIFVDSLAIIILLTAYTFVIVPILTETIISSGYYKRGRRMRSIAVNEAAKVVTLGALAVNFSTTLGIAIVCFSVGYVILMNKYLWGTVLAPAV